MTTEKVKTSRGGIKERIAADGSKQYQVRIWTGQRDPATGRRIFKYETFSRRGDAVTRQGELRTQRQRKELAIPNKQTVAEMVEHHVRTVDVDENTRESYELRAKHILRELGSMRVADLSRPRVGEFLATLKDTPPPGKAKPLGAGTRKNVFFLLKAACDTAIENRMLAVNPCQQLTKKTRSAPRAADERPKRRLSAQDVAEILRIMRGHWLHLPVATLAFTGLRIGELCALRWCDLSIDEAPFQINVNATAKRVRKKYVVGAPKANNSKRTVLIDETLAAELRRHRTQQAEQALNLGATQLAEWYVFPASVDQPTAPGVPGFASQAFRWRLRRTAYKGATPHALRHAHGSILLAQGRTPVMIAARLGHSVQVFMRHYAHEIKGEQDSAVRDFGAAVARGWEKQKPGAVVAELGQGGKRASQVTGK